MKNRGMIYGFMDESGAPGVAISSNDYFLVVLVLFSDYTAAQKTSHAIIRLRQRLKLPDTFEFHRKNNLRANQLEFINLLSTQRFKFITVAIKKNQLRQTASYNKMAELLIPALSEYSKSPLKIIMDTNALLHRNLIKVAKLRNYSALRVAEVKSHKEPLLQVADYLVNIQHGRLKHNPKAIDDFQKIAHKELTFIQT